MPTQCRQCWQAVHQCAVPNSKPSSELSRTSKKFRAASCNIWRAQGYDTFRACGAYRHMLQRDAASIGAGEPAERGRCSSARSNVFAMTSRTQDIFSVQGFSKLQYVEMVLQQAESIALTSRSVLDAFDVPPVRSRSRSISKLRQHAGSKVILP